MYSISHFWKCRLEVERSSQSLRKNLLAAKAAKVEKVEKVDKEDKVDKAKISKKRQMCFFHPGK